MVGAQTYSISELSSEFDITTRTIRFYEDKGLLAPERDGQKRIYSHKDRVRLRLIMRGKRLGFSLDEIQELLELYESDKSEVAQLSALRHKIAERKETLFEQLEDINALVDELDVLDETCQEMLRNKGAT